MTPHGSTSPDRLRAHLLRDLATLIIATTLVLSTAAAASAHEGGGSATTLDAGPYSISVYDGEPSAEPGKIRYTLIVRDAATGEPVDGATVRVAGRSSVAADSGSRAVGPVVANGVANVYEYALPDPGEAAWRIRATVESAAGTARTAPFTLHGLEPELPAAGRRSPTESGTGPASWPAWLAGGVLVAAAASALMLGRLRRRRPAAETMDGSR